MCQECELLFQENYRSQAVTNGLSETHRQLLTNYPTEQPSLYEAAKMNYKQNTGLNGFASPAKSQFKGSFPSFAPGVLNASKEQSPAMEIDEAASASPNKQSGSSCGKRRCQQEEMSIATLANKRYKQCWVGW